MSSSAAKIELKGYEELLGKKKGSDDEGVIDVPVRDLKPFRNHPYKVIDDERMNELVDSIKSNGVIVPLIVRRTKEGYEIVSGHRRKRACELAGLDTVPVKVMKLDDDEATVFMVDSNLQREELLPSEKAWAYRLKLEALGHQGRSTSCQVGTRLEIGNELVDKDKAKNRSDAILASGSMDSSRQIHRYIRLTYLLTDLIDYVDKKKLSFIPAVNISYLNESEQQWVLEYVDSTGIFPNLKQSENLKKASEAGKLNEQTALEIIEDTGKPPAQKNFSMPYKRIRDYFPPGFEKQEMESVILMLLGMWKNGEIGGNDEEGDDGS